MQQALQINIDEAKRNRDAVAAKRNTDDMADLIKKVRDETSRAQKEGKGVGSGAKGDRSKAEIHNLGSERDDGVPKAAGGGGGGAAKMFGGFTSDVLNPMMATAGATLEMMSLSSSSPSHVNIGTAPPFQASAATSPSVISEWIQSIRSQHKHKFKDYFKVDEFLQKIAESTKKSDSVDLKKSEVVLKRLDIGFKLLTLIDQSKKHLHSEFQSLTAKWPHEDVTWGMSQLTAAVAAGDKEVGDKDKDKAKNDRKLELDDAEEGVKAIKLLQNTAASMIPSEINRQDDSMETLIQNSTKNYSDPKCVFDPATDALDYALVCICCRFYISKNSGILISFARARGD